MSIDWAALNAFLDKWGFQGLLLVVIGLATYFWIWPLIQKRIARVDKLVDEQQARLEANQREYQKQADDRVHLFTSTLNDMTTTFNQGQDRIATSLNQHDANSTQQHAQMIAALQAQSKTLEQIAAGQVLITRAMASKRSRRQA
jgi:hypothetical protein